jgi:catechol 2,3-dioxygenase-like lactoylglutathione lyase family enzyme
MVLVGGVADKCDSGYYQLSRSANGSGSNAYATAREPIMLKLDHLALPVTDEAAARAWYVDVLGMTVEFEVPATRTVAVKDEHDFALFLVGGNAPAAGIALWFQVDDVDASHAALAARGVAVSHPPQPTFWGYGCELADPDGYLIRLWDETTMQSKSKAG